MHRETKEAKKSDKMQKNGVAILSSEFSRLYFIYVGPKFVSCSYFRSFENH